MKKEFGKDAVRMGHTCLGIELGSTRIKAVLIDESYAPIASGSCEWENRLENGIWTYHIDEVWTGLQACVADLKKDVQEKFGIPLTGAALIGISGMMHGYLAFDKDGNLLAPFRTWRNTITEEAAADLTEKFGFNIPQRWSVAHLWQAILNGEPHVKEIDHLTTLAGYVHWKLTGQKVMGVGEASGMFPIDSATGDYDERMLAIFDKAAAEKGFHKPLRSLLPKVLSAGEEAGKLTPDGAKLLCPDDVFFDGAVFCPPEGDAGTGMVATNSVLPRTGNVSAGTSIFAMAVLERPLKKLHTEIDMVTTPSGDPVAMVHCNNCTSDINAWANMLMEFASALGVTATMPEVLTAMFRSALKGEADCGGVVNFNYVSGEHITGMEEGRPLLVRTPDSDFSFGNFSRAQLYSALASLKIGMDILMEEGVELDTLYGHGGFFKTKGVGQKMLSGALNTPIAVMETAGEGGPWGMALLASYIAGRKTFASLGEYLNKEIFAGSKGETLTPDPVDAEGFKAYIERYKACLPAEKAALKLK
ncbi:MAG: FGGY-family carbohydrate kinase [Oscillospiraceae bacterium]|nr:FGGY-family carbohydrate kinase [Oscillospiraceae bacterium]